MILTANRSRVDWYPLFPNPVVAESLLDRLSNSSHQVFMKGPSYRPDQRPGDKDDGKKQRTAVSWNGLHQDLRTGTSCCQ